MKQNQAVGQLFLSRRRFVFFLDPCNIDIVQRKIKSMALCVSLCPTEELKTYQDLKKFAMLNGELTTVT